MRFVRWTRIAGLLLAGPVLCQCAALQKTRSEKKEDDKPKTQTLLIGTVELVNPEQRYVLIQCDPSMILGAGTELTCLDATGTTSTVVITPERKGNFVAADIKEGTPRVKNLVLRVIHTDLDALVDSPAEVAPPASTPAVSAPMPAMNGPLDSGLPPLEQDPTIEPGSVSIPPGGIDLEPVPPASNALPPVIE